MALSGAVGILIVRANSGRYTMLLENERVRLKWRSLIVSLGVIKDYDYIEIHSK